jgi:hypothetical protein
MTLLITTVDLGKCSGWNGKYVMRSIASINDLAICGLDQPIHHVKVALAENEQAG